MKKIILAALLGIAVIGSTAPINVNAASWGASLNPAKVWRANENGGKITSLDHEKGSASASLDQGPDAIYAIINNSKAESRSSSTYIELDDSEYLKNENMSSGIKYTLYVKNAKTTVNWVWASGNYYWD